MAVAGRWVSTLVRWAFEPWGQTVPPPVGQEMKRQMGCRALPPVVGVSTGPLARRVLLSGDSLWLVTE